MKKTKLLLMILAVALLAVIFAGCQQEPVATEPPVMEAYWNIYGALYNNNGVSSREAKDGVYTIEASHKGKLVKLKVADKALVDKIDSMQIFGVVMDGKKNVSAVKTVEDMGGKIVYEGYELDTGASFEMNVLDPEGKIVNIKTPSRSCFVTDLVSYPDEPERVYPDELIRGDKIVAVQDYQGNITDVFFYKAGLIRSGIDQYCPHCCDEGETAHFEAWTQYTASIAESGHYFLFQDLELPDQLSTYGGVEAVLDLNGFTVSVLGEKRVCAVNGKNSYLGVMDSSEEKTGKFVAYSSTYSGKGTVVWVSGENATFELFAGTLDGSLCYSASHGSCVNVNSLTATFIMHEGGKILGGTTYNKFNEETGKWSGGGHGGAVCNSGTFIMYGGSITGGKAECSGSGTGRGGNIAVMGGATFEMYGGSISGGTCDNPSYAATEGDLYVAKSAKTKLEGGTIGTPESNTPAA